MDNFYYDIYESMQGLREERECLPWVANLGYPEGPFDTAYNEMTRACWRICEQLGKEDDADVECMRNAYEKMQHLLCRQMFACGAAYALMKENRSVD